jgi:hypothetical protein
LRWRASRLESSQWFLITERYQALEFKECIEIELALVQQTALDMRGWRLAPQSRNSSGSYQLSNLSDQVATLQVALWVYEEDATVKPLPNKGQIRLEQARLAGAATALVTLGDNTYTVNLETGLAKSSTSAGTLRLRRGPPTGRSSLAEALMESGNEWEERLLGNIQRAGISVVIAEGTQKLSHRRHSPTQTLDLLQNAPLGYLYQTTLVAPPSFYARFGVSNVTLSQCYPDLIHISRDKSGKRHLRIVDAKQSEDVKLSHKIQVCFYSLILRAIIEYQQLQTTLIVSEHGGVWLGDRLEYQKFILRPLERYVSGIFLRDLDSLSARSIADVPYNLTSNCQYCEFLPYCKSEAERDHSILQLPRQSEAKKALVRSMFSSTPDIEEAAKGLTERWPTLGQPNSRITAPDTAWLLRQDLETFRSKTNRPYGFAAVNTPLTCDVLCTLSLLQHSVTRRPVAFLLAVHVPVKKLTWLQAQGPDAFVPLTDGSGVYCCRTVDQTQNKGPESWRLAEILGTALAVLLDQLDAHNMQAKPASQLSLLITLASHVEASWLKEWLISIRQDSANFALGNLFNDASILQAGRPVRFFADLSNKSGSSDTLQVLEQVLATVALSVPVVGDWDDLLATFGLRQAVPLDSQPLLQLWFDQGNVDLAARLLTRASVLSQLFGMTQTLLGSLCSKLRFPFVARRLTELRTPHLQTLGLLVEYEQFSQARKLTEARKYLPLLTLGAMPSARFIELQLHTAVKSGVSTFATFSMPDPTAFLALSENTIGLSWVLAPRAQVLALTAYDDYYFRGWFKPMGAAAKLPIAFAKLDDVVDGLLRLSLAPSAAFVCEPGADYVLMPRNVDFLSSIHFDMLREIDWVHSFTALLQVPPPAKSLVSAAAGLRTAPS